MRKRLPPEDVRLKFEVTNLALRTIVEQKWEAVLQVNIIKLCHHAARKAASHKKK